MEAKGKIILALTGFSLLAGIGSAVYGLLLLNHPEFGQSQTLPKVEEPTTGRYNHPQTGKESLNYALKAIYDWKNGNKTLIFNAESDTEISPLGEKVAFFIVTDQGSFDPVVRSDRGFFAIGERDIRFTVHAPGTLESLKITAPTQDITDFGGTSYFVHPGEAILPSILGGLVVLGLSLVAGFLEGAVYLGDFMLEKPLASKNAHYGCGSSSFSGEASTTTYSGGYSKPDTQDDDYLRREQVRLFNEQTQRDLDTANEDSARFADESSRSADEGNRAADEASRAADEASRAADDACRASQDSYNANDSCSGSSWGGGFGNDGFWNP